MYEFRINNDSKFQIPNSLFWSVRPRFLRLGRRFTIDGNLYEVPTRTNGITVGVLSRRKAR